METNNDSLKQVRKVSKVKSEKNECYFDSLNSKQILTRLFDNPDFDNTGAALFTPNYNDRMKLPVSFDGKCHVNIDTTMYFTDHMKQECAVVIFTYYNYVKDYSDTTKIAIGGSHFTGVPLGVALFTKSIEGVWQIYEFKKHFSELGYFGTYRTGREDQGKISLKEVGDKWTCLSLKQGIGGSTGISWGYESLYAIEKSQFRNQQEEDEISEWYTDHLLKSILTYNYFSSSYEPGHEEGLEEKTELKMLKRKNDYFDLELVSTKNKKVSSKKYYFSEEANSYIQRK